MHKWVKDNPIPSSTIEVKGDPSHGVSHHYITDPSEILDHHGKVWGGFWQVGDGEKHRKVIEAIREALDKIKQNSREASDCLGPPFSTHRNK